MSKGTKLYILFCLLVVSLVFGMYFVRQGSLSDGDQEDGFSQLHVEGTKLVKENGKEIQLIGMSSHGLLWYPEYTNAGAMATLKEYGANTFRIAVYSDDEGGGYVQQKEETMRLTYMAIENAINEDMYIIVDWHVLWDGNPLVNKDSAIAFFDSIGAAYGDCPNIIYEICNEPNGYVTWDEIYTYANEVIPVIRKYAPNSVVLVGTPNFSYSIENVFNRPLSLENVMYTFHYYAGQHDDYYKQAFELCEEKNIPVFVSEWGINYNAAGPAVEQGEAFVTELNRRGISWTAWALANKNEVFSAIKPDCNKFSGWTEEDLTDVGKVFFHAFQ